MRQLHIINQQSALKNIQFIIDLFREGISSFNNRAKNKQTFQKQINNKQHPPNRIMLIRYFVQIESSCTSQANNGLAWIAGQALWYIITNNKSSQPLMDQCETHYNFIIILQLVQQQYDDKKRIPHFHQISISISVKQQIFCSKIKRARKRRENQQLMETCTKQLLQQINEDHFSQSKIRRRITQRNLQNTSYVYCILYCEEQAMRKIGIRMYIQQIQKGPSSYRYKDKKKRALILEILTKYQKQVDKIIKSLQNIDKEFSSKQRECLAILRITQRKINILKIIHIQYGPIINQNDISFRYSVSAYDFFKATHQNPQLKRVVCKGVSIQEIQQFIRQLNLQKKKFVRLENKWILAFSPAFKLTINLHLQFLIQQQEAQSKIDDLSSFVRKFQSLSEIKVKINLQMLKNFDYYRDTLQNLLKCLKLTKRIHIEIQEYGFQRVISSLTIQCFSYLFGRLASFTTISKLSIKGIQFRFDVEVKCLLAIQEILRTLFQNNNITHLELYQCSNLPLFLTKQTLTSIMIKNAIFRKKDYILQELIQQNPSIQYINCSYILQQWTITPQVFQQLHTLIIKNCDKIILKKSLPPSNIKILNISFANIGNLDDLQLIFCRLDKIISLRLANIDFGDQLLCTIPSPHLEELHIKYNRTLTNQGLKNIDSKWPKLKEIQLRGCRNVSDDIWKDCEFKGLVTLMYDWKVLDEEKQALQYLRMRGVKINS